MQLSMKSRVMLLMVTGQQMMKAGRLMMFHQLLDILQQLAIWMR